MLAAGLRSRRRAAGQDPPRSAGLHIGAHPANPTAVITEAHAVRSRTGERGWHCCPLELRHGRGRNSRQLPSLIGLRPACWRRAHRLLSTHAPGRPAETASPNWTGSQGQPSPRTISPGLRPAPAAVARHHAYGPRIGRLELPAWYATSLTIARILSLQGRRFCALACRDTAAMEICYARRVALVN